MERNCFQKMLSIFLALVLVLGYVPMNARADEHVHSEDDYANAAAKTAIVLSEEQSEDDSLPEPESDSVSAAELPVVAASLPEIVLPSGTCAGCRFPYSQCYSVTGGQSNWRQHSSRYPDCHVWWCAMGSKETYHELHNMNGTNGECTVCGYLHSHKSDTQWSHDEDNHWHKCTFTPCEERFDIEAHTKKEIPSVDATCTKTGLTAGMYCSVCDAVLVEQTEVDALGHDPVHHDAKAATCTEDGWDAYDTCSRCDYTTFSKIDALGHDPVHHDAKAATCTEDGWDAYDTCSRCDYTTFSKISATGHQYNENHICTACDAIGGTCGEHLSWAFSTDGTLTITGSGAMVDYPLDNSSPWYAWRDSIKNLILEDGITTIGDNAFKDCTNISSVNIPYGVTKIGNLAFGNCTSLADVSIPNTVTRIDFSAFRNCSKLREIIFSGDAPEIKDDSFCGVSAAAYYPAGNVSWTSETRKNYGGTITWLTSGILLRSLELDRSYVTLPVDDSLTLNAAVDSDIPVEIRWSVEDEIIATVSENGTVTALNAGTTYVIASVAVDDVTLSARCRVDVTAEASETAVTGVQLGTSAVTTELFKTDYAEFDVILLLDQNRNPVSSALSAGESRVVPEDNGVAVASAKFADAATAALFDLAVKDDRTLLVVPKADTIANAQTNPRSIAGSYTSKVVVTVGEETFTTDTALNLTVKNSLPKLNAAALTFNPFYTGQSQVIQITGATVKAITEVTLPSWLDLNDGVLALGDDVPTKGSYTAVVSVQTEEWVNPVTVSVPVKLSYAAPKLKLSASSVTFAAGEAYKASQGVTLKLQCAGKTDTLESLNVSGIQAPEGFVIQNFDPADGSFILKPTEAVTAGTKEITVSFLGTTQTVILKPKVSTKAVSISAKPSTVTLNSVVGDSAAIPLTATPADYQISGVNIRLTDSRGGAIAQDLLACKYSNGLVIVRTVEGKTQPNATYKLYVSTTDTAKETVLTVKTLADTEKTKPTVSAKVTGGIDLSFPESCAVVTPVFKNYASGAVKGVNWTVTESKGKTLVTDKFSFSPIPEKNQLQLSAKDGLVPGNTYLLSLTYTLSDDSTCSCTAKITVKRTPVKLKLSKTSLSLNRKIGDTAVVDVTCQTKGYDFTQPVAQLILPGSKDGQDIHLNVLGSQEPLTVSWSGGKLTVTANATAEAGKTYKIALKATENDPAVTLSVKILDTAVTASLKAKGAIDVVRDSTAITVTPSYRNYMGLADISPELTVESGDGKTYKAVAEGLFDVVRNETGSYTITKVPGANVDTTLKYRAKLTFNGGNTPAYVNLAVKSGTAKVAVSGTPVLYKADRFSRDTFRLTAADKTLNSIVKAAIKDAKYQGIFEVYFYGNGEFAIGFKGNKVPNGKLPASVVLNVYADGNLAKSVASVTLKVQIQ